jgi:hypothetical protein
MSFFCNFFGERQGQLEQVGRWLETKKGPKNSQNRLEDNFSHPLEQNPFGGDFSLLLFW